MNLSQVKSVVTDMDGTLLNNKGAISPKFFPLFKQLREHDFHFAVASGRQYYSLKNLFNSVKEDMLFIAENGALTVKKDKQIYCQPIDPQMVEEVIRTLKDLGEKYIIVCDAETAYTEQSNPQFIEIMQENYSNYEIVCNLEDLPAHEILNITICNFSGAEKHTIDASYRTLKRRSTSQAFRRHMGRYHP